LTARHHDITHECATTIFAAGRLWDEAKNLRAVVDAAPHLAWPVRIAGEGGEASPNVTHLGRLETHPMAAAYASAGVYLFPALYEPFGLSILEAALSGCALVLGDIPSLREIWGDAAVFVPPRDVDAIVDIVNKLTGDDTRRHRLAVAALNRAQEYTVERMAEAYLNTYEALARTRVLAEVPA